MGSQPMKATGNRAPKGGAMHLRKQERNLHRDECQRAVKRAKLEEKAVAASISQPVTTSDVITDERYGKLILALVSSTLFKAFLKRWTDTKRPKASPSLPAKVNEDLKNKQLPHVEVMTDSS